MAKIWQISDGRSYVVNGDPGTTITYTNSPSNGTAAGKPVTSIPTGATSVTFPSNGSEVEISSDTATIDQVFNAAAAGSGSSSGGSGSAGGVTFQIVTTLPSQGAAGVIYLVKVSETGDDKFEEWIWVDSAWESIGTTAVDPTTYAKLIGGNTFEGNQVINGDLTVTGDVSGVTESNYNVVETTETTITPTGGTWVRYTGTETTLTVTEPGWDGEAEISYLETTTPVDLQGVTWSPAKPILTGNGPFVYTLVHSREGEILAGAYGYSVATAEAVQAVVPIACGNYYGYAPSATGAYSISIGGYAKDNGWGRNVSIGVGASSLKPTCVTIGAAFEDTDGSYKCQTQGTGSITIGAGANTLSNGSTESSNSVTIGCKASNSGADSVVIGAQASNTGSGAVLIGGKNVGNGSTILVGNNINANSYNSVISMGVDNIIGGSLVVAIGREIQYNKQGSTCVGHYSSAAQYSVAFGNRANAYAADYTVAVGSGATITNTGSTPSENTIVIGTNATASAPNAVVMGAGASATGENSIVIGAGASGAAVGAIGVGALSDVKQNAVAVGIEAEAHLLSAAFGRKAKATDSYATAVGSGATAVKYAAAVGHGALCTQQNTVALGSSAKAAANRSIAIGASAAVSDLGATVIRSTAEDGTYTQLYFSGANTPLANTYANGEAIMGYVTSDSDGNPLASGFKRLSALFDEGTMTQPATLDEFGEWSMPKVFHPSDLDLPIEEEPTEEPEDVTVNIPEPTIPEPEPYTPLPVYPIVTPEDVATNIPETEPYTPLPVYPIVEPEVPEIVEEPTE